MARRSATLSDEIDHRKLSLNTLREKYDNLEGRFFHEQSEKQKLANVLKKHMNIILPGGVPMGHRSGGGSLGGSVSGSKSGSRSGSNRGSRSALHVRGCNIEEGGPETGEIQKSSD